MGFSYSNNISGLVKATKGRFCMQIAIAYDYLHARRGAALWCGGKVLSEKLGFKAPHGNQWQK